MVTIGQTLSTARIAAGCSLEQLSKRTRIRMRVLRAIENDDFVPCGGDFYARGHIRRLSRCFGVDPGPLLEEYEREHALKNDPASVPLPRRPVNTSKAARIAAAQREEGPAEAADPDRAGHAPGRSGGQDREPERGAGLQGGFAIVKELLRQAWPTPEPEGRRPEFDAVPGPRGTDEGRDGSSRDPHPEEQGERRPYRPEPRPERSAVVAEGGAFRGAMTRTAPVGMRDESVVRRHWPWAVVGIILVAAVFVGVRSWQSWEGTDPTQGAFEVVRGQGSGGEETLGAAMLSGEVVGDRARMVQESGGAEKFTVELTGSGRSWVKVTDPAEGDLFTGFLVEGQTLDYVGERPLTMRFGNAGVVEIAVDGEDLGPGGDFGEVKEVTIGSEGLED